MKFISRLGLAAALLSASLVAALPTSAATVDREVAVVRGFHSQEFTVVLQAGVSYRIVVDGDGDSDLDAYLYDEGGHLIDSDTDSTDLNVLLVTPRWTGPFKLRVVNVGSRANLFKVTLER